jgi:hypothetical protein
MDIVKETGDIEQSARRFEEIDCPSWIGGVARSAGVVVPGPNRDSQFIGEEAW